MLTGGGARCVPRLGPSGKTQRPPPCAGPGAGACADFGAECDHSPLHRGLGGFLSTRQKGLQAKNRDLKSTHTL